MKKISFILFIVFNVFLFNLEADEHTYRFEKWVAERTDKLLNKAHTLLTTEGYVQYSQEGTGSILLILHGGFGGWDQGEVIGQHFRNEGFSILSVSRPGYLGTDLPELPPSVEFTPAQQADVVLALLDALHLSQVFVLGFSAGAPVAYELAKNYPERVKALVLESLGPSTQSDLLFYPAIGNGLLNLNPVVDFVSYLLTLSERFDFNSTAKLLLQLDTDLTGPALNSRIHFVFKHHEKIALMQDLLNTMIPLTPRLRGIINDFYSRNYWVDSFKPAGFSVPTLIIQAINDANEYFSTVQSVHQRLPTSELIPVKYSGHFLWFGEDTRAWQKKATKFLREHKDH